MMNKKIFAIAAGVVIPAFIFTGCNIISSDASDDVVIFEEGEYKGYSTREYDGKTFISYGYLKPGVMGDYSYAIGDYIGYLQGDEEVKIYTLKNESSDEWLIEYVDTLMSEPDVLRELSTMESDYVPESVEPGDNSIWK